MTDDPTKNGVDPGERLATDDAGDEPGAANQRETLVPSGDADNEPSPETPRAAAATPLPPELGTAGETTSEPRARSLDRAIDTLNWLAGRAAHLADVTRAEALHGLSWVTAATDPARRAQRARAMLVDFAFHGSADLAADAARAVELLDTELVEALRALTRAAEAPGRERDERQPPAAEATDAADAPTRTSPPSDPMNPGGIFEVRSDDASTDAPPSSQPAGGKENARATLETIRQDLRYEELSKASLAELLFYGLADHGGDGPDAILRAVRDELHALSSLAMSSVDAAANLSHVELGDALDQVVRRLDVVIELNERAAKGRSEEART